MSNLWEREVRINAEFVVSRLLRLAVVERTDKFRAVIVLRGSGQAPPVFGEFANGRELGVSGTVSAKYAEGTDEELGLAGVSVNGVAADLDWSAVTRWG